MNNLSRENFFICPQVVLFQQRSVLSLNRFQGYKFFFTAFKSSSQLQSFFLLLFNVAKNLFSTKYLLGVKDAPYTSGLHQLTKELSRSRYFCLLHKIWAGDMGRKGLHVTEFHVFLKYSFFFPDLCVSENASFIADREVSCLTEMFTPSGRTNFKSKLNKTDWYRPKVKNQLLF